MTQTPWPHDPVDREAIETMDASSCLRYAFETFGSRAAIGTSLQKSGLVLVDLASKLGLPYRVFFVDTLLNHDETYELLGEVNQRYGMEVECFRPKAEDIESLYRTVGQYAHFLARPSCCQVRKVLPLRRAMSTLDVWITGLRADQSEHRESRVDKAQWVIGDDGVERLKLNPLRDWSLEQIDSYIRENDVPYNKLYDYESPYGEKYFVIGCPSCHIPTREELGKRAGKFPWEQGKKECGLHEDGSGI